MSTALNIILFLLVFALLIATSVFLSIAASDIGKTNASANVHTAYSHLVWASILGWVSVGLVILGVILFFLFGVETIGATGGLVLITLLAFILVVVIIVGILAAISAANLSSQPNVAAAYRNSIIASVLALGGVGLLIILLIVFWVGHRHGKTVVQTVDIDKARQEALARLAASPSVAAVPATVATVAVASPKVAKVTSPKVTVMKNTSIPSPLRTTTTQRPATLQDLLAQNDRLRAALLAQSI